MHRLHLGKIEPYWFRVSAFLSVMFLILLSDAVLSDFVPAFIQTKVGTPVLMGIIMAASSVVGLAMDLIFPQFLRNASVRKLAGLAMIGSAAFLMTLYGSTWSGSIWLLLMGMACWGVYYELDAFMTKQFVADAAPAHARGSVWGVVGVFRNLAYFLGPLIGGSLLYLGDRGILIVAGAILMTAYVSFLILKLPQHEDAEKANHGVQILEEIRYWTSLGRAAWPVLIMSIAAGIIDATFWTTGTVVNDQLASRHPAGAWFLSMYMMPNLIVGVLIAKWGIYKGKKKWAERFLGLGGLTLMSINFFPSIPWILGVVFAASIFFGLAWPLVDAVYSDFVVRMKKGRKHMIGLSSSTISIAYIIGPILAGFLAGTAGELQSFAWLGLGITITALGLLMVTPRKIKLPQTEIGSWE